MNVEWKDWFWAVWEDNRRLTDRVVQAFVDAGAVDQEPVAGMRPFRQLLLEIWGVEQVYTRGFATEGETFDDLCTTAYLPLRTRLSAINEYTHRSHRWLYAIGARLTYDTIVDYEYRV